MPVLYDYILTFGDEVELFWGKRLTGSTVLFMANRYLGLCLWLYVTIFAIIPPSEPSSKVRGFIFSVYRTIRD